MELVRKLNNYFIADEEEDIPVSDYLFFYGIIGLIVFISIVIWIPQAMNFFKGLM